MKKFIALLSSALLIFTLAACGGASGNTADNDNSGNTGVTSQPTESADNAKSDTQQNEVKVVITPPSGWTSVEGTVLPAQYMKNTASFMVKSEPFSSTDLEGVVAEAKGYFEKSFDNVAYEGDTETITVDGRDARKFIFTCAVSKMKMKYEYVYLFVGSDVYAITFGDLTDTFDSLSADYGQILKDIKFQ